MRRFLHLPVVQTLRISTAPAQPHFRKNVNGRLRFTQNFTNRLGKSIAQYSLEVIVVR